MYLLFKITDISSSQCFMGMIKKLPCLVGDKFISDIIFIFEIKIESSLGYTCLIYNI